MYKILIFSKYMLQERNKVNNLTPVYFQNCIYTLAVFQCDPIEPTCFKKSQTLLNISSKMHFLLPFILSACDDIKRW